MKTADKGKIIEIDKVRNSQKNEDSIKNEAYKRKVQRYKEEYNKYLSKYELLEM